LLLDPKTAAKLDIAKTINASVNRPEAHELVGSTIAARLTPQKKRMPSQRRIVKRNTRMKEFLATNQLATIIIPDPTQELKCTARSLLID
jgi:hypothetical protein